MHGSLAAHNLQALCAALDVARVGLAIWDADDRLGAFNSIDPP